MARRTRRREPLSVSLYDLFSGVKHLLALLAGSLSVVYESLGATLQFETTCAAYSDRHDYLAYMLVAFQVAMGLDDVIEGEDLVDDRVQGA